MMVGIVVESNVVLGSGGGRRISSGELERK